jgi:hypothetical protein
MVKKIIVCVFIVSFIACGSSNNTNSTEPVGPTEEVSEPNLVSEGFFLHPDHKYGFDKHPNPKSKEDNIVHVSVLDGDSAVVTLGINPGNYNYYICDPTAPFIQGVRINNSGEKYSIAVKDNVKKIALCREREDKSQIIQELHIHPYKWKEYDFDIYILGNGDSSSDRHQLLNRDNFWQRFDEVFKQALGKHGKKTPVKFIPNDKGYVLTRVKGEYKDKDGNDTCVWGDVRRLIEEVSIKAMLGSGNRRVAIQVGYPTKKFWPLKEVNGNVEICGNPKELFEAGELEALPLPGCSVEKTSVHKSENVWRLGSGKVVDVNNVNPECVVFVKTGPPEDEYLEENSEGALGTMWPGTVASIAVLPRTKDILQALSNANAGTDRLVRTAIHELGHTLGLFDLSEEGLSYVDKFNRNEENNLMNSPSVDGEKLRQRGIMSVEDRYYHSKCDQQLKIKDGSYRCIEYQWDCLQSKSKSEKEKNCMAPIFDPYYNYNSF